MRVTNWTEGWSRDNVAEYRNTTYKEDQFLNIVKSHESNQPIMNSAMKTAVKVLEEISQSNENSDTKQEGMQQTRQDWESP